MSQSVFAYMGGLVTVVALSWNAVAIIRGKVQPALVSWAIWASLDIILAASMYAKGVLNPQMAVAAIGAGIVFVLAIPFGKPGWNPIDKWCLAGGVAAVVLWFMTGNATLANILSLTAIAIGCIPTYASIAEDQSREDKSFWCLAFASSGFALLGTKEASLDALAPPIVFVVSQAIALRLLFMSRTVVRRR